LPWRRWQSIEWKNQDRSYEKYKSILLVNLRFAGAAGIGFLLGLKKLTQLFQKKINSI